MQKASGLKLAGQGMKLHQVIRRVLDSSLAHRLSQSLPSGLMGSAALGAVGSILKHADEKGVPAKIAKMAAQKMKDHLHVELRKHPVLSAGARILKKHAADFIEEHKDKDIHIKDVLGADWKPLGNELLDAVTSHYAQQGQGKFSDALKRAGKKGLMHFKRFVNGKTKVKPSDILNYAATAVGLAGTISAAIPEVDLISVPTATAASSALKGVSATLKKTGRGLSVPGGASCGSACGGAMSGLGNLPPGVTMDSKGKIRRDKYSVWHGLHPSTRGKNGLTKDDLMLKPGTNIVISKKKHAQGKKIMQEGKGIYKS